MSDNNAYDELREKFFAFILKRPCTHKQANEYLSRMNINDDVIDSLMNEAESSGLIDDLTYAKLFAEGHSSWGNLKITYELSSRGISRENINIALDDIDDEVSRACDLADSWKNMNVDAKKITARLMSRGFTNRAVRSALRD